MRFGPGGSRLQSGKRASGSPVVERPAVAVLRWPATTGRPTASELDVRLQVEIAQFVAVGVEAELPGDGPTVEQ